MKPRKTAKPGSADKSTGSRQAVASAIPGLHAVQPAKGHEDAVRSALEALGEVGGTRHGTLLTVQTKTSKGSLELLGKLVDDGHAEFASPVLMDSKSALRQILQDEITVRFKKEPAVAALRMLQEKYGLSEARQNQYTPQQFIMKFKGPKGMQIAETAERLSQEPNVQFAAPNFLLEHQKR